MVPHRSPHGPIPHHDGTATFRVWAPRADHVELVLDGMTADMEPAERGWWSLRVSAKPGDRYAFRLDGGKPLPDPASRRQPDGVHEASALVDPTTLAWSPEEDFWRPSPLAGAAIYELHVGTFTPEGTLDSAIDQLPQLADLGITHVEVMPVAAFNGTRGWGYDGVSWYAVHEPYGGPEAFAAFVGACHAHGLAVILDVVYNHLGPSGNYLPDFGPYLTDHYETPWGDALNLDGAGSDEVRSLIIDNALMWLADYHVDGLRLDAVHGLVDTSATHILAELSDAVRDLEARVGRPLQLIAESDRQDPSTVTSREAGGLGLDGQWLDDLHHGLHVALTGEHEGYYRDFAGLRDVAASYQRGFVYDGRYSVVRERTVGAPLGSVPSHRLVACLQNHDQIGNRALGERLTALVDADRLRAATLLLCAAPSTPMLFMGEEYGETRPFLFFSSHPEPELAEAVSTGRREEFSDFAAFDGEVPDPQDPSTFTACVLDWLASQTPEGHARRRLWRDLLFLRREEPALVSGRRDLVTILHADDDVLAALRAHPAGDVLVLANLGDDDETLRLAIRGRWEVTLSTDATRYGGAGRAVTLEESTDGLVVSLPGGVAALCAPADS